MLNIVRVGNIDDDVENLLKARFIREADENYPEGALHMNVENELAMKKLEAVLNEVQGLSLELGFNDFDLQKQKSFGAGQMYTALSRIFVFL